MGPAPCPQGGRTLAAARLPRCGLRLRTHLENTPPSPAFQSGFPEQSRGAGAVAGVPGRGVLWQKKRLMGKSGR